MADPRGLPVKQKPASSETGFLLPDDVSLRPIHA